MTLLVLLSSLVSFLPAQSKKLRFENLVYEPEIKSVQLYNNRHEPPASLSAAATSLGQSDLLLEFDDLRNDLNNYYVRILHFNYDWSPSTLRDLDFMYDYNEFNINDYVYSNNTEIPYVHYSFLLPQVKIPGNFLLVVYRDGDKNDLILSHRFVVFENRTSLRSDNLNAGAITLRSTNQQLNFIIDYRGVNIVSPLESVHVVVRQNQRWDNARIDIKPSFVREDQRQIEYRMFGDDKFFEAGNEFRFVDFRSINFPGQNTAKIDRSKIPYQLWVQPDQSREGQVYSQYPDINGQYLIDNLDQRGSLNSSQYVDVVFTLQSPEIAKGKVYVLGEFNQWAKDDTSQMSYDAGSKSYSCSTLLKQGWYNYQYWIEDSRTSHQHFEGNHFQTENLYEILVYYRPFQPNADLLIGYFTIPVNAR